MVDLDALQTVAWERHNLDRRQMLFTDRLAREQDLTARLAALMRPVLEGHPLWQQLHALGYVPTTAAALLLQPVTWGEVQGWMVYGSFKVGRAGVVIEVYPDRAFRAATLEEALVFPLRLDACADAGYVALGNGRHARAQAQATLAAQQLQRDGLLDAIRRIRVCAVSRHRHGSALLQAFFAPQDLLVTAAP